MSFDCTDPNCARCGPAAAGCLALLLALMFAWLMWPASEPPAPTKPDSGETT